MSEKYIATKCPCQDPVCQDWHVWPIAAVQGVKFTEEMAKRVASLLNGELATGMFADTFAAMQREEPKKLTDEQRRQAMRDLATLEGLPPYDGPTNTCRGDGYFASSIERKFGMGIDALKKASGFDKYEAELAECKLKVIAKWMHVNATREFEFK